MNNGPATVCLHGIEFLGINVKWVPTKEILKTDEGCKVEM